MTSLWVISSRDKVHVLYISHQIFFPLMRCVNKTLHWLEESDRCRSSLPLIIHCHCEFKTEMVNTDSWLLTGVKLHWPVFWLCPRSFLEMFCCCRFRMRCCSCFSQRRRPLLKAGSSSISFWTRTSGLREPSAAPTLSLDEDDSPSSLLASSSCKMIASKWAGHQWGSWSFIYLIRILISFHIVKTTWGPCKDRQLQWLQ